MLILDTNIYSVMMQPHTAPQVIDWLKRQPVMSVWTTTITLFEIRYGLSCMPTGRKRQDLEDAFVRIRDEALDGRVLDFDTDAAIAAGDLYARLRTIGKLIEVRDIQIAGVTASRQATLVTRNVKDFANTGINLIDPWTA
jgi:predicted nucleic acid-binding protein